MARPTLGPAYGNTDRSTSPRLMGGTPDISSQAPIATQELAAPGIQAVARMVETFSQPGQGPTIGGPLQISAPPRLGMAESAGPARLPRPVDIPAPILGPIERTQPRYAPYVDNMGAMARALSGFSTFFKDLETYATDREKRIDTAAKTKGTALAQEVSQGGFFSSLQDAQKHLEKGAAQGLAGYDDLLRRFQAADPRALRYATLGMQDAYVKNSLATLQERISQTRTLLDGRPLESVNANEPAFQQMMTSLAFPNGTQGLLPEVWEANKAQLSAIYGIASAAQEKRFGEYKTQKAKQGLTAIVDGNAAALVNNSLPAEQIAANLSAGLDGFYSQSGQTSEEYRKELGSLAEGLIDSVLLSSAGDWGKEKQALGRLPEVLAQIRIGPAQDGDKRPLLLDSIGGVGALHKIMQKAQQKVLDQQNLKDQLDGRDAQEQADLDIQQLFPADVLGSPASIDAAEESALARGRQIYANNPEAALAYEERVRKHAAGIRAGYVQPVQEQNEVSLWAEMAQNPNVDYTQRILQLQQSQLISQSAAKSFLQAQGSRNREDNKANYQVLRGLQEDLKKRLEAQYARGSSEGGANLTPNEARQLWQTLGELYKSGDGLIRQNPGADMTRQLGDLYGNALSRSLPQQVQQPPATATPEALAKGLGGGRGDAQRNAQLRRQAETQPLYSKQRMGQQLDTILGGKPLDDSTRLIIRRSGMKPSDFFTRQMQLHGIPLDAEIQKRLKELDGGDLVSQAGGGTSGLGMMPTNRYLPVAQRLGQQFASWAMNTLVPPAAAAPMPMGTASVAVTGPVNINRLREAIVGKESGGSFTVVNPDSGAIGIGQVMPENVGPWTAKHFGRRLTPAQFRNNRQAQIAVVNGQLNEILQQQLRAGYDSATAIRRAASIWYSGQGNLYNDSKPQYSNGQRYPSIKEYTLDILRRYNRS